jgi:hypothetical protein
MRIMIMILMKMRRRRMTHDNEIDTNVSSSLHDETDDGSVARVMTVFHWTKYDMCIELFFVQSVSSFSSSSLLSGSPLRVECGCLVRERS